MCFPWISERTTIVSPNSVNLSVFITGAESVYCMVRNGSLNRTATASSVKGKCCEKHTICYSTFFFWHKMILNKVRIYPRLLNIQWKCSRHITHALAFHGNFLNSITSNSLNIYSLNYMDSLEQWLQKRKV